MKWAGIGVKIGSFTRDLSVASGTAAITGVGFQPDYIEFSWGFGSGASGAATTTGNGASDGSTHMCSSFYYEIGDALTVGSTDVTHCVRIQVDGTTTQNQIASVSALGADGFTLSWTKGGTPTGTATIMYKAFNFTP